MSPTARFERRDLPILGIERWVLCTAGTLVGLVSELVGSWTRWHLDLVPSFEAWDGHSFLLAFDEFIGSRARGLSLSELTALSTPDSNFSTPLVPVSIAIISSRSWSKQSTSRRPLSSSDFCPWHRSFPQCIIGSRSRMIMCKWFLTVFLTNSASFILRAFFVLVDLVLTWPWSSFKSCSGFLFISEAVLWTCAGWSMVDVLTWTRVFVLCAEVTSLWFAHFHAC